MLDLKTLCLKIFVQKWRKILPSEDLLSLPYIDFRLSLPRRPRGQSKEVFRETSTTLVLLGRLNLSLLDLDRGWAGSTSSLGSTIPEDLFLLNHFPAPLLMLTAVMVWSLTQMIWGHFFHNFFTFLRSSSKQEVSRGP